MSTPILHMSLCVIGFSYDVFHISGVTSDRVWVSDGDNLILQDTSGYSIHRVTDIATLYGVEIYTVNSSGELIYMDMEHTINKLSINNQIVTILLERPESPWEPRCVYCSPSTGDLMVGMYNHKTDSGQITRYNSTGQHMLTISHDNTSHMLYKYPVYIKDGKEGDIYVSDWIGYNHGTVVVTERGRDIDSPTQDLAPSGPLLYPHGICTDALLNILVCDGNTATVQMIDKDGNFLSLLLTQEHGIHEPWSLNYDDKTHLLWVGSECNNTVSVYRYIQRKYFLIENTDSDEWAREASCGEEIQEHGTGMDTSDGSEYEENSVDLTSEESCQEYVLDG